VADYSVNIALAIKGARQLKQLRNDIKSASKSVDLLNRSARKLNLMEKSFNNMGKVVGKANAVINKAVVGTDQFTKAARVLVKTESEYNKMLRQKEITLGTIQLQENGMNMTQKERLNLINQIGKENVKNMQVAQMTLRIERQRNMAAKARRGLSSAVGSGIIGGGFPLLFGQGPISALGGAAGGVAGGALSAIPGMGQFGFALSIAGTAIGSAMEDLAQALKKPEENIENLVNKLGLVGTPTGDLALKLEKVGATSSAARILLDEFNEKMGKSPEELLATTKQLTEFKNKVNELGTEITLFLSTVLIPFINAIGGALDTNKLLRMLKEQEGTDFFQTRQAIVNKANERAATQFKTNQAMGVKNPLSYTQLRDQNIDILLKEALGLPAFDKTTATSQTGGGTLPLGGNLATQTFQDREIEPLKQALQIEQNRLNISGEKLTFMKEQFELQNLLKELSFFENEKKQLNNDLHDETIQKLKAQVNLQKEVVSNARALADPFKQVSNIIQVEMGNGIKDLIKGTRTLGDVMRSVVDRMTDALLNLAIFGNIGGGSITGGLLGSIFRAEGGPVRGGGSYIVGERGPELFTPGVSGSITPNNALGGSTNIVVNVDASGSSVGGNEEQGRELGILVSAAVQSEIIQQQRPGGLLA